MSDLNDFSENQLEGDSNRADDLLDSLRLDGWIPGNGTGRGTGEGAGNEAEAGTKALNREETNCSTDDFVTIDINDESVIELKTPSISHYVFLVLLFRIQRVVVSFCQWAGKRIFTQDSLTFFRWQEAKASILVYYNQETGQKREVDLVFDIPTFSDQFQFQLQLLLEHKSYPDDEEPLQSLEYVNLMYRKQAAEQKGRRVGRESAPGERNPIRLNPVVRVKLYHGKSLNMGISNFEDYFRHLPPTVLRDLKPYISMNQSLDLNLRILPLENFPGADENPELFLGLKSMRDVLGENLDQSLIENFDWLISQMGKFDSEQEYKYFGSLIIRYMDHYCSNMKEDTLEHVNNKFQHSMGDKTMGVLEKYYRSGLEEGRQEGRQEGIANLQNIVIRALRRKFGVVPEDIQQRVKEMTDYIAIESLVESVIDSESLEEFRGQLP